jgi:hypothetical protein
MVAKVDGDEWLKWESREGCMMQNTGVMEAERRRAWIE